MRTLLSEQYAPITSSIGFLRLELDKAVAALVGWRTALGRDPREEERPEGFPACLHALEPLVGGGHPRELFVATNGPWTAYFDNGLDGTDAVPPMSVLASAVGCDGLAVRSTPHSRLLGRSAVTDPSSLSSLVRIKRSSSITFGRYRLLTTMVGALTSAVNLSRTRTSRPTHGHGCEIASPRRCSRAGLIDSCSTRTQTGTTSSSSRQTPCPGFIFRPTFSPATLP